MVFKRLGSWCPICLAGQSPSLDAATAASRPRPSSRDCGRTRSYKVWCTCDILYRRIFQRSMQKPPPQSTVEQVVAAFLAGTDEICHLLNYCRRGLVRCCLFLGRVVALDLLVCLLECRCDGCGFLGVTALTCTDGGHGWYGRWGRGRPGTIPR